MLYPLSYKREVDLDECLHSVSINEHLPRPKAEDKRGVFSARMKRSELSPFVGWYKPVLIGP